DPTPQIDLVRHVERQEQIAAAARAHARGQEGSVRGVADRAGSGTGRDRRKQRGPVEADDGPGFAQPRLRDLQILVAGGDLLLQCVELGIAEDCPPLAPRQLIARLRGLPALRLLVGWRPGHRGLRVVRTDHAAAEQEDGQRDEARAWPPHRPAPAGALAIRTGVPLVRESDGATMTWSVGRSPERISTGSP